MTQLTTESIDVPADDGTTLPLYVARPDPAADRGAGILVLQEIFGVNAHIRDVTSRFAREGYLAVAPALFHRVAPGFEGAYSDVAGARVHANATTLDHIRSDLRASHAWLAGALGTRADRIATIGYCMGGRHAFLANSVLPLRCAISYYGANIVGLADLVPKLHGHQLFVWGGRDAHIGLDQRRGIVDAMIAANKPYTDLTFGDADHGFFCDVRGSYHAASAREVWELTKSYLATHLGD